MQDNYYYKIINDNTGSVDFYVTWSVPVNDDKVCEILNIEGHHAESISKEEFEKET